MFENVKVISAAVGKATIISRVSISAAAVAKGDFVVEVDANEVCCGLSK
jgi:hypothetical protein